MSYETPITIKKAIDNIKSRKYVLPSIQREFVWSTEQIETLFDSLMRDYPISTFLFWTVDQNSVNDFQFYDFLREYHEVKSRHNLRAQLNGDQPLIALLDGQQRMTSLYIALNGTYAERLPNQRKNNPNAYPEKKLYLNLLKYADSVEMKFDFKFLTIDEANNSPGYFWFECGNILALDIPMKVTNYLMANNLLNSAVYTSEQNGFALNTLNQFFNIIHQKGTISYYLENSNELDKVLQIFIRVNSGGTKLSYSDLLLSIATAQWKDTDAREVIHEFVDEINNIGDGFNFNKDIVLKSCLVLNNLDVKFKVDNFTKDNMKIIESNWIKTSSAFRSSIQLISKLGYSRESLLATNAIIPIAYFIHVNNYEDSILHNSERELDRKAIKEWLARVLLKGTFGGQPDAIYPAMRDLINQNLGKFPIEETINYYKGRTKSISFTEDDLDGILNLQYGQARAYCALTILYPSLNNNFKYHQDHIHPKSFFNRKKLKDLGVDEAKINEYLEQFNGLANLQLLETTQNIEKSDKTFEIWLNSTFPEQSRRESFLSQNYINPNQSLDLDDFLIFIRDRSATIKNQLKHILNVT